MARARGGGSGSAWAVVLLGAGFFICMLLAIVFYTQIKGAQQAEQAAKTRLAEFATQSEQGSPEIDAVKGAAEGRSIVRTLLEERDWLRTTIASDASKSQAEIESEMKALQIDGAPLLQTATRMKNELAGANEMNNTLTQEVADARTRANEAEKAKADLDQGYKDSLDELKATLAQTTDALETTRRKIQEQKSTLDGQMSDTRGEYVSQLTAKDQEISDLEDEIRQLRKTLADSTGKRGQDPGPGNLTRADGRIVSIIGGRNEVYVNLGRADRLQMGMTFEVFDTNEPVKINEYDQVRGKATLEIVSVEDNTAVARIVRLERGRSVLESDQIVNLVYDPQAVYKFYVYGDFNVDGATGDAGRDMITSKIRQWGGDVADKLSYDVDYLVLGAEPPLPTPPAEGVVDPQEIQKYVVAQREYETYQQLIGEARDKALQIPILNQNRFLALIGHYDR